MIWITFSVFCVAAVLGQCPTGQIENKANLGSFPYMVSIQSSTKGLIPFEHVAGGAIISPMWVITAALTFTNNIEEGPLRVQAGFVSFDTPGVNMQTVSVAETTYHPKYRGAYSVHDLALLKLTRPLQLNSFVQPVLLPFTIQTPKGEAIFSHWSHTQSGTEASNDLTYFNFPLISTEDCLSYLKVQNPDLSDLYNCCTLPDISIRTCRKNIGSPLVQDGRLIGVMSWSGNYCTSECVPFVYTRIDSELDFVRSVTGMDIG